MNENKRYCIFHVPNYIDPQGNSGSNVRPMKMIQAFENNGYQVDCVMGYGKTRKRQIEQIKKNIASGYKYDFLYAENCTMPTILTEKNHFPRYPFMDFDFFKFCKQKGIKIGLFYRDIYWKFPIYKKEVSIIKRMISVPLFQYDLKKYGQLLDYLYLPSMEMKPYIDIDNEVICKALPPGCDSSVKGKFKEEEHKTIHLFYVGGVGELYDLAELFKCVRILPFVELVVCCREKEWQEREEYYATNMCERIKIVHKAGEELSSYYDWADICMLFFQSEGYRAFAMPIKLFEYIAYAKPVIATQKTAAGEFVSSNHVGWSVPYSSNELQKLLRELYQNPQMMHKISDNMITVREKNTWDARANQVIKDLN